jgi:predicted DNA-binding transcriptional regulator AlpA
MQHLPQLMSMKDVMAALCVSRQRVYEFIRKDKLHPQTTAAGKIFLESEVMAFKRERAQRLKPKKK